MVPPPVFGGNPGDPPDVLVEFFHLGIRQATTALAHKHFPPKVVTALIGEPVFLGLVRPNIGFERLVPIVVH